MKKRTAVYLVILSMILSSMLTLTVVSNDGLFSQVAGQMTNPPLTDNSDQSTEDNTAEDTDQTISSTDFAKIKEAYDIIQKSYMKDVEKEVLIEGAIKGMLDALGDPYSVYMDPELAKQFEESMGSSFEGIGAEVSMQNGRVTIVSPFKDSPADRAGLRPHDQIISVNGENIEGMDLYEAVQKIRGPKGTRATLKVIRPGVTDPLKIVVIRDMIPIETIHSDVIEQNGKKIGKIEITNFIEHTAEDFRNALEELTDQNVQGIIIDVRGNPGGYLKSVQQIADMLVPKDSTILQVEYNDGNRELLQSTSEGVDVPIVVLIDKGSASASEILAAVLQHNGHKLVGKTSFGKGTVQSVEKMADNTEIKISIAKWLTPSGDWIHEKGIQPDVEIDQPEYFYAMPLPSDQVLKYEMVGNDIKNLQLYLEALGFDPGRKDGYYSMQTVQAVKQFQQQYDLEVTGEINEETAQKINEIMFYQVRDPEYDFQFKKAVEVLLKEIK